jgi:enoyl-[acyl-carrier-protein] reductase (NADH)
LNTSSITEEVAHLARFIATDRARTITGQSIVVDAGGVMMGGVVDCVGKPGQRC